MGIDDPAPPAADASNDGVSGLTRDVETLRGLVRELEEQLGRLMDLNARLEKEISDERRRRAELELSADRIRGRVRQLSGAAADGEQLEQQAAELRRERASLVARSRSLAQRLQELASEETGRTRALETSRAEQTLAVSELSNVEAQLERALRLIVQGEASVKITEQEIDALRSGLGEAEQKLEVMRGERDELVADIQRSRAALEKLRSSLDSR